MWNRILPLLLCLALAAPARAETKPYRVSLLGDRFDGTSWHSGIRVELDPGWKTYWRMPGDSGIPPEFTWRSSSPAKVEVAFPTPARHVDKSGETVGYEGEVIFPVTITPESLQPLELDLDMFFAVCKDVCVPAKAQAAIALGTEERDPLGSARVEAARAGVPAAGDAVTAAEIVLEDGKPVLKLAFKERAGDIFVEAPGSAYFHAPLFSGDGRQARLAVDGIEDPGKLQGKAVTLTYTLAGKGHQQTIILP